jgi:hypothetical protein
MEKYKCEDPDHIMYKYNLEKVIKEQQMTIKGFVILAILMFVIGWAFGSTYGN